jgi:DNA primase
MYYCFGCGKGGNVFTFVMEHDKVSFVEAARTLAKRVGIEIPEEGYEDRAQSTEFENLFAACRTAALFYVGALNSSVEGQIGTGYFTHRGFSPETVRRFGLGYSPNAWDALARHVESAKLDLALFERAGLLLRRGEGEGYYDRFRGRAMFPIFSATGRVIAFGARKLREDDPLGKYINSPETPIYSKSRVLYGLYQAREAIRAADSAILVEGYADLISLFQAGIENVVASSGTALTEEQIHLIGRYTKNITLVYDADSAGSKAALRGADLVIENGLDVRVASLPEGEDPDSFVRKAGAAAVRQLLDGGISFLDFKAEFFRAEGLLATPEGKTRAVRSLVETLARMKDELKRTFFIKSIAEKYSIYESILYRELEKQMGKPSPRAVRSWEAPPQAPGPSPEQTGTPATAAVTAPERALLKVMIEQGGALIDFVFQHVQPDAFTNREARAVVNLLLARRDEHWEPASLVNAIEEPELKSFVANLVFSRHEISRGWEIIGSQPEAADPWKVAEDAILRMKAGELDLRIAGAFRQLKEAESRGESLTEIKEEMLRLQREKRELATRRLLEKG